MALKQLTVFLENKEGHLNDVLKTLADNDVNIIVAALAESADFGILRMIVPESEKAREILKNADFSASVIALYVRRRVLFGISEFLCRFKSVVKTAVFFFHLGKNIVCRSVQYSRDRLDPVGRKRGFHRAEHRNSAADRRFEKITDAVFFRKSEKFVAFFGYKLFI